MTTTHDYIDRVLSCLPRATPRRDQIAAELRDHIDEGLARGEPLDRVLTQLGNPSDLAASYLAEVPLEPAGFAARLLAKLVDAGLVAIATLSMIALSWLSRDDGFRAAGVIVALIGGGLGWFLYTVLAEHLRGATLGKWLSGLHVVRESGARIGLGQAIVRQLPLAFQFFWIDALFALFTDRRQRAFELLSKTCVVRAVAEERPPRA
jgi:uncharacterized RDD family membrane protein YckC